MAGDVLEHPPAFLRVLPLSQGILLVLVGGDPVGASGVVPELVSLQVRPLLKGSLTLVGGDAVGAGVGFPGLPRNQTFKA